MKLNLQINNSTHSPVADEFLQKVAEETFKVFDYDFCGEKACPTKEIIISLALVDPGRIKELNKEYRQHDDVTDVLSFPEYTNPEEIKREVMGEPGSELFLGELVLCYDDIREYAQKEDIALDRELANVVSHGILHLLGFKHGDEMFAFQEKVKKNF